MTKHHAILVLKILISTGLLGWLILKGAEAGSIEVLKKIDAMSFILACGAHLLAFAILLLRWRIVLGINHEVSITSLLRSYYIGMFSSNFLPGTVGGDFVRATYLYKIGIPFNELLLSSLIDRLLGLITTLVLCLAIYSFSSMDILDGQVDIRSASIALVFCVAAPIIIFLLSEKILILLEKTRLKVSWLDRLRDLSNLLQIVHQNPLSLIYAIGLSLMSTLCIVLCYFILCRALGIELTFLTLCIVIPLSFIASSIPVSVGGLGIREGFIVYMLTLFGAAQEQAVALTLLYLTILIVITLPGGILIVRHSSDVQEQSVA